MEKIITNLEKNKEKNIFSPEVNKKLKISEKRDSFSIMNWMKKIRDQFKGVLLNTDIKSSKELISKMDYELEKVENEATIKGVNFSKCQMGKFVDDYDSGKKVEFESFSPYLMDYNMNSGEIWEDKLTKADEIGLQIAELLKENFPKARMISLYDEYNTRITETKNKKYKNTANKEYTANENYKIKPHLNISETTKENFKKNIENLLIKRNIIKKNNYNDYLLISESEKIADAEGLVKLLKEKCKKENKNYIIENGDEIIFNNPNVENPAYSQITLRTKEGRWMCEALDASSYIKEENLKITHLVILPDYFKKQQDQVWEILRVLGIEPLNYHNIFYNENVKLEKIISIIKEEILKYKN